MQVCCICFVYLIINMLTNIYTQSSRYGTNCSTTHHHYAKAAIPLNIAVITKIKTQI